MPQKVQGKKKQNKQQGKQPAVRQKSSVDQRFRTFGHLSDCGRDYAKTLSNPFTGPLGCVPSTHPIMTQKVRVFTRGSFACSKTTGTGFIICDPLNSMFNDASCVSYSINSYAATDLISNNLAAGVNGAFSNSPYTSAQFNEGADGNQGRVVGCGLRIRYTGTSMFNSGSIYAFHDPTHTTIVGSTSANIAGELLATRFQAGSRDWLTVLYSPVYEDDYTLIDPAAVASSAAANVERWYMGFLITGAQLDPNFATYDYEMYTVFEAQGRNVRGMTKAHSDPLGLSAVVNVAQDMRPTAAPVEQHSESFVSRALHNLGTAISHGSAIYSEGKNVINAGVDLYDIYKGRMPENFSKTLKMLPYMAEL